MEGWMMTQKAVSAPSLAAIFDGWDGYHTSIVRAVEPLSPDHLSWRPAQHLRSAGEVAGHLALGRVEWFSRMPAPGSLELMEKVRALGSEAAIAANKAEILSWLDLSWRMIDRTLREWTTDDLTRTYRHEYGGQAYTVSYQWTVWRILTHDIHHGGELALLLGQQGLQLPELGDLFGHLTMPPLAK
jgi:uncharacterized damage-inducible protein DinB